MKSIELILLDEDELPFYSSQEVEIIVRNYENFTGIDKQLLEELTAWLKGENPNLYKIKEAEPAD